MPTHIIEESPAGGIVRDHGNRFEVPRPKPAWLIGVVTDCVVLFVVDELVVLLLPCAQRGKVSHSCQQYHSQRT